MEKKIFIKTNKKITNFTNTTDFYSITNDNIVNDFLNNNVSLEVLIEKEIFKPVNIKNFK